MYRLKEKPEDFIVKEKIKLDLKKEGDYGYYLLTKKKWNTLDAVKEVARFFNVKENDVGYAGNKDKVAITKQYISVKKGDEGVFSDRGLNLEFIGFGDKPISLGDLEGNVFEIVVRGVGKKKKVPFIENYFDEQRFGTGNKEVGKCLVKKDFMMACGLLSLDTTNALTSLRSISKNMLSFYLHSYQSYLWNELVAEYIRLQGEGFVVSYSEGEFVFCDDGIKNIKVPLISFNSKFKDKELNKLVKDLLEREGVKKEDFLIREFPELASLPQERDLIVDVDWYRFEFNDDVAKLKFYLKKGSYATLVVKKMFG
tara:strand:+ start:299 stop:1234 length:936 start_codon:yes stop_codon:yes gene_type:complete